MEFTHSGIAHQRLCSQRIIGTLLEKPGDVVDWLVAVQAQDYAGAKWALGLRMQCGTDGDVEQAFDGGGILRTHLMRPTWHFVTPVDIGWLLALTAPRVHAVNAHMYRKLELDADVFRQSNIALTKALRDNNYLTRDELREGLRQAGIMVDDRLRLAYIMMQAELVGLICSGPRRGNQFTYALLGERAPHAKTLKRDEALAELSNRYFVSRGPATAQDFAKWSGLTVADARRGLEMVKTQLRHEVVNGQTYWLPSSMPAISENLQTAYLLSVYDEYFSSYKDRGEISEPAITTKLNELGNSLSYIIVVNGQIAGTWKRTLEKSTVIITASFLTKLTKEENKAVAQAAQVYGEFLGRTVTLL